MHLIVDILRNSILITGLVVVMMMMIESLNIESKGLFFKGLKKTKVGQVVFGALLGSIPGCMGGFATVSLYTHKMFSFGALIAMMIASSGDEAFIMLAMIPEKALLIFAILFVVAVAAGIVTDTIADRLHSRKCHKSDHSECGEASDCTEGYAVHIEHSNCEHHSNHEQGDHSEAKAKESTLRSGKRHYGWKRISMLIGLAVFITALAAGKLGHDHSAHTHEAAHAHEHHNHTCTHAGHDHTDALELPSTHTHCEACSHTHEAAHAHEHGESCTHEHAEGKTFDLLSEDWMNVLFAGLSIYVLIVLLFASDHFVEEHLWNHIIRRHLLTIFLWTTGVLLIVGIGLQYVSLDKWISDNTALMIILATLIGIIPESGPHMIFVTLFAAGLVPMPVLLASSISQDGHSSLPLLAESRKSFLWAKIINCAVALAVGFGSMLFF